MKTVHCAEALDPKIPEIGLMNFTSEIWKSWKTQPRGYLTNAGLNSTQSKILEGNLAKGINIKQGARV